VAFNAAALKDAAHGGDVQSSAGADILFFSDSGLTTQVASELDSYDNVDGIGYFWVQITCNSSTAVAYYMAVGNPSPPSRTAGVWDSHFMGVWHFGNATTLSATDSSVYAASNLASVVGAVPAAGGKIGGSSGWSNSTSNYISIANSAATDFITSALTLEAWVNHVPDATNRQIFEKAAGPGDSQRKYGFYVNPTQYFGFELRTSSGNTVDAVTNLITVPSGSWQHLVGTYDGTLMRMYLNGAYERSTSQTGSLVSQSSPATIGVFADSYSPFDGLIDELRVSDICRSADWINAEYNNQNAPGNIGSPGFWTFGAKTGAAIARRRTIVVQ
jgi:hypothetical protein